MTDQRSIVVTWATRREGNSGYVLESRSDGSRAEFGPMPAHTVPAFVHARRTLINAQMRDMGAAKHFEPPTTIPDPEAFQ